MDTRSVSYCFARGLWFLVFILLAAAATVQAQVINSSASGQDDPAGFVVQNTQGEDFSPVLGTPSPIPAAQTVKFPPATNAWGAGLNRSIPGAGMAFPAAQPDIAAATGPGIVNAADFSGDPAGSAGAVKIDLLELKNMDMTDVLRLISQKTGINIVSGNQVMGKVTIYLKDVRLQDALALILDANGFAYVMDNGIIRVMLAQEFEQRYGYRFGGNVETRILHINHADIANVANLLDQVKTVSGKVVVDPKSMTLVLIDSQEKIRVMENLVRQVDVPLGTDVFDLVYASVKEVAPKISEALTPNVGTLKFDEVSKRIVVKDTPARLKEIARIIGAFDVRRREVLIEAKIVQVTLGDANKFGVNWEQLLQGHNHVGLNSRFDILSATDKGGFLNIGTLGDGNAWAVIQALQTVGDTRILSSPRISALDNEEAKIMVGSTEPYVTTTTTTPASGPSTTAETINFIDVGVKLFVTPTIHRDNFVTMKIRPEVSSITGTLTTGTNNNKIPIKESSEAETVVMIKDGVTVVIGGLIKDNTIKTQNKVPFFGDVPLIKHAFRSHDVSSNKTEIVIFLTPHIITGESTALPFDQVSSDVATTLADSAEASRN